MSVKLSLALVCLLSLSSMANSATIVDLADIVGGGNGHGTGVVENGINPDNGNATTGHVTNNVATSGNDTDNYVSAAAGLQAQGVNGVFVPDGGNPSAVQTIAPGHTYTGFNNTNHLSWDYIQNGVTAGHTNTMGGVNYSDPGHTAIGFHSNKGLTFDLNTIEANNPGQQVTSFTGVGGIADGTGTGVANYYVFVDGVLKDSHIGFTTPAAFAINVAIGAGDQYLTLVSTDNDGNWGSDGVMFGDPRLTLVPEPSSLLLMVSGAVALVLRRRRSN